MAGWDDFFTAQVGASAALAGLLFVGISLNMARIIATPALPYRALQALGLLFSILLVASVLLIPAQPNWALGVELIVLGAAVLTVITRFSLRSLRLVPQQYLRSHALEFIVATAATGLYAVAGLVIAVWGRIGIYLIVPAVLVSFVVAIVDSWVLLVEINR